MDANLCNATSVLHEPCGSGSDEHEELQHEALSRAATVEDSESHENQLPKPVKPNINGLVARKKGLKCFDVENYAFKDVKIVKERNIFSVKLDSRDTCLWKCCKCLPKSSEKLMNDDLLNAGLVNILSLPLLDNKYPWTRVVCDLRFVCSKECGGKYLSFTRDVLAHSRTFKAIREQMEADGIVEKGCPAPAIWLKPYEEKVQRTLSRMSAAVSRTLIRATAWFLFKLFKSLLSSIVVHKGQMHVIQRTCKMETPVLFLPVHRSHLDYMLLSFILFNFNTRLPYVAAGDNLILPIFGMLMRGLGGFFIRRKMEEKKENRDFIYRAVLHAYMEQILVRGESLEFFIEGGRSRSGKILSPKTGLLSVAVETYLRGIVKDISVVPVSISYEKLPEVNFTEEQLGLAKKSETFWSTVVQSLRSLFGFYGSVRIDFSQPFSLKEFVEAHRSRLANNNNNNNNKEQLSRTYSDCFISSSDDNGERALVHALANHVTHDQSRIHSVSCTQLLAWTLLHVHRKGAPMFEVVRSFDSTKAEVMSRGHGLGFCGLSEEVIKYAISLLGDHLVEIEKDGEGVEFVRPITRLPYVIELSYYANTVNMIFSKESIVANSIYSAAYMKDVSWIKSDQIVEFLLDDVIDQSLQLFQLLKHEFPLIPVCETPETFARSALNSLYGAGIISKPEELETEDARGQTWRRRVHQDDDQQVRETFGVMPQNVKQLTSIKSALGPILETYHVASSHLYKLQAGDAFESEFTKEIHSHLKQRAEEGLAEYEESASLDTLKNCLRSFQDCQIISCYDSCDVRMVGLLGDYQTPEVLNQFVGRLSSFVA